MRGWPRNSAYRAEIGAASASGSSPSALPQRASSRFFASKCHRGDAARLPPPPEKRTSATAASHRSNSSDTPSSANSSRRPRCSRAVCGWLRAFRSASCTAAPAAPCRSARSDVASRVRRARNGWACRRSGWSGSAARCAPHSRARLLKPQPRSLIPLRRRRAPASSARAGAPEIDVFARVAARLIRAPGHRRPIRRALKLGVASLDLAVDRRLDQHQRPAVLAGSAVSARRASRRCPSRPTAPSRNELRHVRPCTRRSRRAAVAVAEITTSCASR